MKTQNEWSVFIERSFDVQAYVFQSRELAEIFAHAAMTTNEVVRVKLQSEPLHGAWSDLWDWFKGSDYV